MMAADTVLRAMAADPFHYPLFAAHRAEFDRESNDATALVAATYTPTHRALTVVAS